MLNLLIYEIMFLLNAQISGMFDGCAPRYVGRQLDSGEVVTGEGEYNYNGIQDGLGNYFYIRHLEKGAKTQFEKYKVEGNRIHYEVSNTLRAVFVYKNLNAESAQANIENLFIGSLPVGNFGKISATRIEISQSQSDFEQIYKQETGKNKADAYSQDIRLTAIDFDLRYRRGFDDCNEINMCCETTYDDFVCARELNDTLAAAFAALKEKTNV